MRPIRFTFGNLAAASANNIATAQSLGAAGNFTLNGTTVTGGVATLDQPRRVLITSAGNDSAVTMTVTGTTRTGMLISESLAGGNTAAVATVNDFATVTKVAASAATSSITIGTNAVASTVIPLDVYSNPTNISINAVVTGTVNYTVNETWDDVFPATGLVPANWVVLSALSAKTTTTQATISSTATGLQLVMNSGSGSVVFELVQSGGMTAA